MRILVTHPIQKIGIDLLKKQGYNVTLYRGDPILSGKKLKRIVKEKKYDALLTLLTNTIDGAVMDAAGPQLKVISNFAVGFDNINLEAARKRKIAVTNTPCQNLADAVADHTIALLFALLRNIVSGDRFMRAGKFKGWEPELFIGCDIRGKTLGLIGLGRIGKGVASRALALGMNIFYHDVKRDELFEKSEAQYKPLNDLLATSDVISLHVPLLPTTRHLINTKTISKMKKGSYLINTSRGAIVDEMAVAQALVAKKLAGYGTDVFECEPKTSCSPTKYDLRKIPNTILTPHIASATKSVRDAMAIMAAQNIIDVLEQGSSSHQVA